MSKTKKVPRVPRGTVYSTLIKDKLLEHIGAELTALQADQGKTLQDLSKASGVTYQTISKVLKGELDNLSIATLDKICFALGAKAEIIFSNRKS